jgi:uncharacterized repeat protein (TIGR02543 family)
MKTQEKFKSLKISPDYGTTALYFIPNEGQVHDKALFYAKASRYTLWMTKEGLVFDSSRRIETRENESPPIHRKDRYNPEGITCERDVSRLIFLNSKKNAEVVPVGRTEHKVNYFIGKDKSKWLTNIQTSRAVLYKELYRNIDLRVYGTEKQIEYDFIVRPGGKILDISFEYRDVEKTEIDKAGNLVIETKFGELEHAKPECYQVIEGEKIQVEARFKRIENNTYGFKVEEYNRNYELIIDPLVLVYSTYLGGSDNDFGRGIAIDTQGAAYVTGETLSTDFPTQNPIQGSNAGIVDVFITKVNSAGDAFVYSTYLGGSDFDNGFAIAVDTEGAAYVTGDSESNDFPTQNPIQGSNAGYSDVFITKVNSVGDAFVYSTYLGGSDFDNGFAIAVDTEGAAYVTGETQSNNFPTQNPIQGTYAGGEDVFITKVNSAGDALVYSTYLSGSGDDYGRGIAVDTQGAAYVTGETWSTDFPMQDPIQGSIAGLIEAFITKLNFSFVYSLTITTGSGGTTNPSPGTHNYDFGEEVPVTAIPNSGYQFSGWSGDASGTSNPITITMDSDKSITANFSAIRTDDGDNGKKGGCFIATAAYGSPLHPYVNTLQDFRDKYLIPNKLGRKLVDIYYRYSSSAANIIAKHKSVKAFVRINLVPFIIISYAMLHLGPAATLVMFIFIVVFSVFTILYFQNWQARNSVLLRERR